MARVTVFQGGNIPLQGATDARVRAADFTASPLAEGLKGAGKALGDFAEKQDQVEDIKARVEANNLLVEHSERSREIGNTVKQTLGEGAEAAADNGIAELDKATKDILGRASPRARMLLGVELNGKNVIAKDSFLDHGFNEKKVAFETSSVAAINRIVEDAADEDDEEKALALLEPLAQRNAERSRFFGHGKEWEVEQNRVQISQFFKSRSLKLAVGPNGSSLAALEYATKNRAYLIDQDYNSVVSAYNDNALDEVATSEIYGQPKGTATVERDPLVPEGEPPRTLDPLAFFNAFTVPHEGKAYVTDSNGAGVKYGINAAYNPGVDVKNLTQDKAAEIFRKKYFIKSGADKLPPALAAVHVDTFYLNESQATKILKASGGDVDRYIQLRSEFLDGLAEKNPAKFGKYQKGWANRTAALANFAAQQGGAGTSGGVDIGAGTSMSGIRDNIMARTDIGLALKTKMIAMAERKRADIRQEREIQESEAQRALTQAALNLGEDFTDIKQLPQEALLSASPATITTFTNMAKGNVENKPLDPSLAAYINFTEVSNPRKFASQDFLKEISDKGAPLGTIRTVAARQGEIAGALSNAKPDPVASGELWTVAKPAFEAAGLLFDTTEAKGAKKDDERIEDAQRKSQALVFLREMAGHWATANPGKKPDEATIRGWVGYSLRQATPDKKVYQLGDADLYNSISVPDRNALIAEFKRQGITPTVSLMAKAYRRARATSSR